MSDLENEYSSNSSDSEVEVDNNSDSEVEETKDEDELDEFEQNQDNIRILFDNIQEKKSELTELEKEYNKNRKKLEKEISKLEKDIKSFSTKNSKIYTKVKNNKTKSVKKKRKKAEGKVVPDALRKIFNIAKNKLLNRNEVLSYFWRWAKENDLKVEKDIVLNKNAGKIFSKVNPKFKSGYKIKFTQVAKFISDIYKA